MRVNEESGYYKLTVEAIPNRGESSIYLTAGEYKELFQLLLNELLKNL